MACSDESPSFAQSVAPRPFTAAEATDAARAIWKSSGLPFAVVQVGLILDLRPGELSPSGKSMSGLTDLTRAEIRTAEMVWALQGELRRMETVARAVRHIREERERERRTRGFKFLRKRIGPCRG